MKFVETKDREMKGPIIKRESVKGASADSKMFEIFIPDSLVFEIG